LKKGQVIADRYELTGVLGRGGMGTVYQAHDRSLDERVALKVLAETAQGSADADRRFRAEIRLARKIRHPNVCAIHEYGEMGEIQFIVMELVDGQDLKKYLREKGRLVADEVVNFTRQIGEGLQAIHDAGVVHRDLKLANVMKDGAGRLRLMDFGIAKSTTEGTATASGAIVGTPEYMSPEQVQGLRVDPRSDLYALGIMTYELLTGRVPFKADTPLATIMLQMHEAPQLVDPAIPQEVVPVLLRALAKKPEERYESARTFVAALADGLASVSSFASGPVQTPPRLTDQATVAVETPAPARTLSLDPEQDTKANQLSSPQTRTASLVPTVRRSHRVVAVAGAAAVLLIVAGLALSNRGLAPTPGVVPGAAPPPAIGGASGLEGDRVDCLIEAKFSELHVQVPERMKPPAGRLYFKSNLSDEWFYTEVEPSGEGWRAFIPKVNKDGGIKEITYYFSVSGKGSSELLKTEPRVARVIARPSECPSGGRVADLGRPAGALSVLSSTGSVGPGQDLVLPIAEAFGFQTLAAGLKDADADVRLATATSLAEMAQEYVRVINEAVALLRSQDAGDRQQAGRDLEVTARRAVRGAADALIASLPDKDPRIRRSVATTLGHLGQALARARAALSVALRDADKDVRVSATQAQTAMGSVVTTTAAALRTAEDKEQDDQTGDTMSKARKNIEDALSAGAANK
jgi:serine/threonine protein kinase